MITIPFADILTAGNFKKINDCFRADGVIVYPTDTLYGLGGNFFSLALSAKIDLLKKRHDRPYSVAVGSLAMLESLTADKAQVFHPALKELLPGKFTFLFAANPAVDVRLLKNSMKIGIRMPGLPLLLELIETLGMPMVSTSVNRSGQPPLNDPGAIDAEFPGIDILLDAGMLPPSQGSTIVDLSVSPPRLVRPGDEADKFSAWFPAPAGPARS
jgi:L-threonylcarbamoyladenylate synthase